MNEQATQDEYVDQVDAELAAAMHEHLERDPLAESQAAAKAAANLRDPLQMAELAAERDRLAAEHKAAKEHVEQGAGGDEKPPATVADPLQMAVNVLGDAYTTLQRNPHTRLEHKIALGSALAKVAEVITQRTAFNLQAQMTQLALQDRNAAAARNPSGIVVPTPHLVPNGQR